MSEWQPIETYRALKKKPMLAVFWFKEVPAKRPGGHSLSACADLSVVKGCRECTHWMPLPEPPKGDEE